MEAGVRRHSREEYYVRPDAPAPVGDGTTCALRVDDGPKSRRRQRLGKVDAGSLRAKCLALVCFWRLPRARGFVGAIR